MLIDLHMHERTYSDDSFLRLEDMVAIAQRLGLDAIAITDHDHMGLRETAASYSKKIGFPIFVGVEYYSLHGDIVAFGIEQFPRYQISAQEFIDYVHSQGGVCFAAHPFRSNRRGLEEHLYTVEGLDGIEAFNGSTTFEANYKALTICRKRKIQPVGVSDCHVPGKVGVYATRMPDHVTTMPAFLESFRKGLCQPVAYIGGKYVDLLPIADHLVPGSCLIPEDISGLAEA